MDLDIAREALLAQEYLRSRGVTADLVIMNERASSYAQDMQHALDAMCENVRRMGQADGLRQHIFAVRKDLMEEATYHALIAASRVTLHTKNGKVVDQINRAVALFAPSKEELQEMERAERNKAPSSVLRRCRHLSCPPSSSRRKAISTSGTASAALPATDANMSFGCLEVMRRRSPGSMSFPTTASASTFRPRARVSPGASIRATIS